MFPEFVLIGLFLLLAGFIIGLGAVTVVDLLGFLGRKSSYWTEATTRTHQVTKPLIWLGMLLAIVGGTVFFWSEGLTSVAWYQVGIATILVINGAFLSFEVSPFLLERERLGRGSELLPEDWQTKITVSFLVSFLGWWIGLLLVVVRIVDRIKRGV